MKKITLSLLFGFLSFFGFSQIGLVENFDAGVTLPTGWTSASEDYAVAFTTVCDGRSVRANFDDTNTSGSLTSPNVVGQSNGTDLTIAFDYKIVDWSAGTDATSPGWGELFVQYSTDNGGAWNTIGTINDTNHVTSADCANISFIVPAASLPTGSDFRLRIDAAWAAGTYYVYLDNIAATQVVVDPPSCVNLITPANGATGVSINTSLEWSVASGIPTGYNLSVGTSTGGTDVVNNENVGLSTTYTLPTLEYATIYYVNISPFNGNGPAVGCTEFTFTTGADPNAPVDCASGVPVNTVYCYTSNDTTTWNFQSSTGAPLVVFFNAGQMEDCCDTILIYDGSDNTGTLLYDGNEGGDLTGFSQIAPSGFMYIEIDSDGSISCDSQGYTPLDFDVSCVDETALPNCNASLLVPANGETGVSITTTITWSAASVLVTGYTVSIGTTPGGTDIANAVDVGPALTYDPGVLAYETIYYVTIVPYNDNGSAINCNEQSFTTKLDPNQIVDCDAGQVINTVHCYENGDNQFVELYSFQSSNGDPLSIYFNSGTIEDCCDRIRITELDGTVIYENGNDDPTATLDFTGMSFVSTGNTIVVLAEADGSISCGSGARESWDFDVSCVDTTALPNCNAVLTSPVDGAVDVNENDDLTWSAASIFVTGYTLYVGTTPGGTDVINGLDVGNVLTYEPGTLDFETTYYVTIIPYNDNGDATGCTEESFTTRADPNQVVDCSINEVINTTYCYTNNDPMEFNFMSNSGAPLVLAFTAGQIEAGWDEIIILDSDGSVLFQGDNGGDLTGLVFTSTGDSFTIQIDSDGSGSCQSSGYTPWNFDVSCLDTSAIPNCNAVLTSPVNGEVDVNENDDLTWTPATIFVTGYTLYMGTTPGGTDVLNGVDVGDVLTYDPGTLDYETTYYVTIIPYNDNGDATDCNEESFTTRPDPNVIVDCDAGAVNTTYCYTNNDPMIFYFASSSGFPLVLEFNAGEIEDGWDEIIILDSDGSVLFQGDNGGDLTGLSFTSSGDTLSIQIDSDGTGSCSTSNYIPWDFDVHCQTCLPQTVDFNVVNGDCNTDPNNPTFEVAVDISDMGDATSLTITNNLNGDSQEVTETGTVILGPFAANSEVVITVANTNDENCVEESGALTFTCPPPPNPCSIIYAGEDDSVDCTDPTVDLTANYHIFGQDTNTYEINALETCPTPPSVGGTPTSIDIDDVWSDVIDLGFQFCFFGQTYDQILIGSNGVLSFDLGNAGGFNDWNIDTGDTLPNSTNPTLSQANIFGVAHDINPAVCGDINYVILGASPSRQFVVNYSDVCHFGSACTAQRSNTQIILYESSNAIDINIFSKETCTGWNDGNAVAGIQNPAGTVAYTPPGRNTGVWSATDEFWRFTPSEGAPNFTFEWQDEDGNVIGTDDTVSVTLTEPSTYTASITYNLCTGGTATITDDVFVDFINNGTGDASFTMTPTCDGGTATITGDTGGTFAFNPVPTDTASIDENTGEVTGGTPGTTYTVEYSVENPCLVVETQTVTVLPEEDASFTMAATCDGGTATVLGDVGGIFSFTQTPTDGAQIDADTGEITGGSLNATVYTVTYTTGGDCPATSSETIESEGCVNVIPEVITPNNDGFNDSFDLSGYNVTSLEVFNRNGVKVYNKTNGYVNEFRGLADNGDELPVGTYFYVMKYQGNNVRTSWLYITK